MKTIFNETTKEEIRILMEEIGIEFCERDDEIHRIGDVIKVRNDKHNVGVTAQLALTRALFNVMK